MTVSRLEKYCLEFEEKNVEIGIIFHDDNGRPRYDVYNKIIWKHNEYPPVLDVVEKEEPYETYNSIKEYYNKMFDMEYYGRYTPECHPSR